MATASTIAFGQRVPEYDPAWDARVEERSYHDKAAAREALALMRRNAMLDKKSERALFSVDPHPPVVPGPYPPPPPGWSKDWAHDNNACRSASTECCIRGDVSTSTGKESTYRYEVFPYLRMPCHFNKILFTCWPRSKLLEAKVFKH